MQSSGGRADEVGEPPLDVHVQVFQSRIPRKIAVFDLILHRTQAGDNAVRVVPGDDALLRQHGGVSLGAGDVLAIQPAVVVNGNGVFAVVGH